MKGGVYRMLTVKARYVQVEAAEIAARTEAAALAGIDIF